MANENVPVESDRLKRTLGFLKNEFFLAGSEWMDTRDSQLIIELHALVAAINEIEVFLYDKRMTTLLDVIK